MSFSHCKSLHPVTDFQGRFKRIKWPGYSHSNRHFFGSWSFKRRCPGTRNRSQVLSANPRANLKRPNRLSEPQAFSGCAWFELKRDKPTQEIAVTVATFRHSRHFSSLSSLFVTDQMFSFGIGDNMERGWLCNRNV